MKLLITPRSETVRQITDGGVNRLIKTPQFCEYHHKYHRILYQQDARLLRIQLASVNNASR